MKKLVIFVTLFVTIFVIFLTPNHAEMNSHLNDDLLSVAMKYSGDPSGYASYIANFEYLSDANAFVIGAIVSPNPQQMLIQKKGDCDDFAKLHMTIIGAWGGYNPRMYVVYTKGKREGHAIVLFNHKGRLLCFDNQRLIHPIGIEGDWEYILKVYPHNKAIHLVNKYGKRIKMWGKDFATRKR